jgi:hypothetical protein
MILEFPYRDIVAEFLPAECDDAVKDVARNCVVQLALGTMSVIRLLRRLTRRGVSVPERSINSSRSLVYRMGTCTDSQPSVRRISPRRCLFWYFGKNY